MTIGSTAKAFNGNSGGSVNGVGSDVQSAAEGLVTGILDDFMPKVIKTTRVIFDFGLPLASRGSDDLLITQGLRPYLKEERREELPLKFTFSKWCG